MLGGLGDVGGCGVACVTFGVMFKKDLNPTYTAQILIREHMTGCARIVDATFAMTSPVSLKSEHRPMLLRAKKSSIRRVPMLYPIFSSCLFTSA